MGGYLPARGGDDTLVGILRLLMLGSRRLPVPTASAIGHGGERAVANQLMRWGYRGNWDTRLPGSTDIEAWNSVRHLVIQVKSALYPNSPPLLSPGEEWNIRARASRIGAEAWAATVQVDFWLNQVGEISWRRLLS